MGSGLDVGVAIGVDVAVGMDSGLDVGVAIGVDLAVHVGSWLDAGVVIIGVVGSADEDAFVTSSAGDTAAGFSVSRIISSGACDTVGVGPAFDEEHRQVIIETANATNRTSTIAAISVFFNPTAFFSALIIAGHSGTFIVTGTTRRDDHIHHFQRNDFQFRLFVGQFHLSIPPMFYAPNLSIAAWL